MDHDQSTSTISKLFKGFEIINEIKTGLLIPGINQVLNLPAFF
jgi:hypothetical protein